MQLKPALACVTITQRERKISSLIVEKVVEQLKSLPYELQVRVLEFTRALALAELRGVSGSHLLCYARLLPIEDVQQMRQAIEEGCEQMDTHEW